MTVETDDNEVGYTGNGVTTVFAFNRKFYSASHIEIYFDAVIQTSGYTISGVGTDDGYVTFDTAPSNGVDILIKRVVPYRQSTDFSDFDGSPSDVTEKQFDLNVMMSQQLNEVVSRALVAPVADTASNLELPDVSTRAGKALFFDGSGNPSVTSDVDTISAAAAAASASLAEAAQTAAEAAQVAAEAAAVGIKWRPEVKAATTANITLSGAQTIDGISCIAGDRVLVKNQSTAANNGIYVVAAGSWTRATDADSWSELVSLAVSVEQGSSNADTQWICTSDTGGTLGVTAVNFAPFLTSPRDASVTYAKVDPNAIATSGQITSGTASKLVDAAGVKAAVLDNMHVPICVGYVTVSGTTPTLVNNKGAAVTVARIGSGVYEITFTTALADANFYVEANAGQAEATSSSTNRTVTAGDDTTFTKTTTKARVRFNGITAGPATATIDPANFVFKVWKY